MHDDNQSDQIWDQLEKGALTRRPYLEPRIPCTRVATGGWAEAPSSRLTALFSDPSSKLTLTGSALRRNIVNKSGKNIYVFDRTGELIETIPATFLNNFYGERMRVVPVKKGGPKPQNIHINQPADETLYTGGNGEYYAEPKNPRDNIPNPFAGEGFRQTQAVDPGTEYLAHSAQQEYVRSVLLVEALKVDAVSLLDEKKNKELSVDEVIDFNQRERSIQRWSSVIDVDSIEGDAWKYDGCDAIYHPGLGLYFSTNKATKYVGKLTDGIFATLTSSYARLKTDSLYPLTVFAHEDVFEDVFYYSNDGEHIFAAPILKTALVPRDKFRVRIACFEESKNKTPQSRAFSYDFERGDLRASNHYAVFLDADYIVGLSLSEVQAYLKSHPKHGQPQDMKIIRDSNGITDHDSIKVTSLENELSDTRHRERSYKKQTENLRESVEHVVKGLKEGSISSSEEVIKQLQRAQTTLRDPANGSNMFSKMAQLEKTTKSFAGVSKNVKEIALFSTAAIGAVGTISASVVTLRSKWKGRKQPQVVIKEVLE